MLNPALAVDMVKRFLRLKQLFIHMINRSHKKKNFFFHVSGMAITRLSEEVLCNTSIFACMPEWSKAFIKRFAAIAAPPVLSDVLTKRTFIRGILCKVTAFLIKSNDDVLNLGSEVPS